MDVVDLAKIGYEANKLCGGVSCQFDCQCIATTLHGCFGYSDVDFKLKYRVWCVKNG